MSKQPVSRGPAADIDPMKSQKGEVLSSRSSIRSGLNSVGRSRNYHNPATRIPANRSAPMPARVARTRVLQGTSLLRPSDLVRDREGAAVRGADCWEPGQYEVSRYFTEFMAPNGFRYYVAAAPSAAPVFEGYPGALHLYRSATRAPSPKKISRRSRRSRASLTLPSHRCASTRKARPSAETDKLKRRPGGRTFIFDSKLQPVRAGALSQSPR